MKSEKDILKAVFAGLVSMTFWSAHHYQNINQPMPNGKGGFMSFQDGYYIALVCILFSIASFIVAYKSWWMKS
jgi:hypothetical protein